MHSRPLSQIQNKIKEKRGFPASLAGHSATCLCKPRPLNVGTIFFSRKNAFKRRMLVVATWTAASAVQIVVRRCVPRVIWWKTVTKSGKSLKKRDMVRSLRQLLFVENFYKKKAMKSNLWRIHILIESSFRHYAPAMETRCDFFLPNEQKQERPCGFVQLVKHC